jgi:hypothetical protein
MGATFVAGSILTHLILDAKQFQAAVGSVDRLTSGAEKSLGKLSNSLGTFSDKMTRTGKTLALSVTAPILAIGAAAVKMAMNAVESENLFEVSMGNMAGAARAWSVDLNKSLGLNDYEIRKVVGTFNVMFTSMGLGEKAAFDMAKGLSQLGYDMASFYNLKPEEAFQKLQAGITGEVEPLKRLGIVVNETTIQHWALTNGLITQGQTMSEQQKIYARYNVILDATSKAQGDMGRTIESPANQLRILQGQVQKAAIELGTSLLPVMKTVMGVVKDGIAWWNGLSQAKKDFIIKAAGVAAALGPVLLLLGKFASLAKLAVDGSRGLIGQFSGLGKPIESVGAGLKKLPAIAAAAFVGWQIGKAIGDITGLDHVIEGATTKLIKLLGIAKETDVQWQAGHTDAEARRIEALGAASEIAGRKVKTIQEAMDILSGQYKKTGDAGSATLNEMVKQHDAAAVSAGEHAKKTEAVGGAYAGAIPPLEGFKGGIDAAKKSQEEFNSFLTDAGVQTAANVTEIEKWKGYGDALNAMLATGAITLEDYWKGMAKADEELDKFGLHLYTHLPPARDFSKLMQDMTPIVEDLPFAFEDWGDAVGYAANKMKISLEDARNLTWQITKMKLAMVGMAWNIPTLPDIDWTKLSEPGKDAAKDVGSEWDGLFNDIASAWGNTIQAFIEGGASLKDTLKSMWQEVKDSFFRVIGEMISKWAVDLIKNTIMDLTKKAATDAATSIASAGTGISGLAAAAGTVFTTIATIITTLATAIATAIGTIAVGLATALVTLATAIASAATILAAAAVPLLIVGAIAIALFAGFKAIESLFGGGGGKQTDVTYWLKMIHGNIQEVHDCLLNDYKNAYFNPWWNFFDGINWATRETVNVLYAIKDFLGPILSAAESIDSQISKLRGAQHGAISTQTELLLVHGTPQKPEVTLTADQIPRISGGNGGSRNVIFNAQFDIQAIDGNSIREIVRGRIGPELVEWVKTNIGKRELAQALGV